MGDNELNRLPPALRQKKRYLKFKIHAEEDVELGQLVDGVWDKCLSYLGTEETSEADFWVIGNQFNEVSQEGIVKVNREKLDEFRAVLGLIEHLGNQKAFLQVKEVSGSIKKLKDN
jgi:RNase P/RNase MRP subunit POP5